MLNQVILCGRLVENPTLNENEENKKLCEIKVAVSRSFKNEEGIYETDIIPCILWNSIAEKTIEYCRKGDVIGIKGRFQMINDKLQVIADKITFLSARKEESEK
jgi:single-strand DNA-binding protein